MNLWYSHNVRNRLSLRTPEKKTWFIYVVNEQDEEEHVYFDGDVNDSKIVAVALTTSATWLVCELMVHRAHAIVFVYNGCKEIIGS